MQARSRLIAISFIILLSLPTLDQIFGFSTRFQNSENRQLDRMPLFHRPYNRQLLKRIDHYYKENFGGRNLLFYAYSRWKYKVLGLSPLPEKVVVGENGWFYLGNSYNNVVDQHRGLIPLSDKSASLIANHLIQRQQDLAKQGIKLYVLIAPDSETIYPEYLPDHLQQSRGPSRLDVLKRAIAKTSLSFIDIRDTLLAAKRNHQVYYQTDTHWNDYGTLVGCAALLNRIRKDRPKTPYMNRGDYRITQQLGASGDLTRMLALDDIKENVYYDIRPVSKLTSREMDSIPHPKIGLPDRRFVGSGSDQLLFIGDSFSHSMIQYLPPYFRESYFVRDGKLDEKIVHAERPTILVLEIVERNIDLLAAF